MVVSVGESPVDPSDAVSNHNVVVSAQFLIDSESKLREAASKMRETSND